LYGLPAKATGNVDQDIDGSQRRPHGLHRSARAGRVRQIDTAQQAVRRREFRDGLRWRLSAVQESDYRALFAELTSDDESETTECARHDDGAAAGRARAHECITPGGGDPVPDDMPVRPRAHSLGWTV